MYGIVTCIWLKFMENVGKYVIHGSYGDGTFFGFILGITATSRRKFVGLRSSVLGGWLSSDQANGEVSSPGGGRVWCRFFPHISTPKRMMKTCHVFPTHSSWMVFFQVSFGSLGWVKEFSTIVLMMKSG